MNIIFKIIEYLPETNQIIVKFSRQNSAKSIDAQYEIAMSLDSLDLTDNVSLVDSICEMGLPEIKKQDKRDDILTSNIINDISEVEDVDISKMIGNVYGLPEKNLTHVKSVRLKKIKV
tara:strand:- start:127 stop:480 length:354 start_codon:yes stop_codon:yes gene_type:complete